ncbi:hypothetical protein R3W88_031842 [Solanum pinnatisectum]|uniref:Uncharacterized protein n=1 Tax=Solanum pinnatisectum TaxID=50273 RepID=A0AAV9LMG2_9SOLN|nr:hypothetical protein R3W88_031842 [Solanum pinnatisectum]
MSIGIEIDLTHLAAVKTSSKEISIDDGTTMAQKTSSEGNSTNDRNKKEIASTYAIRNQREPTEKKTSPWISTKSLHHKPTLEADSQVEVDVGPAKCSLRSFLTQTRTLQFDKSKQVKEDSSKEQRGKYVKS